MIAGEKKADGPREGGEGGWGVAMNGLERAKKESRGENLTEKERRKRERKRRSLLHSGVL